MWNIGPSNFCWSIRLPMDMYAGSPFDAAYVVEILVGRNLTIWNSAVYYTLVVRDIIIAELR
jgi:hypothetical protein